MKRDFGKGLVEKALPRVELTEVIDTSGAFIPGHGTPTVILLGRHRAPAKGSTVRVVMGRRGEPETPADPAKGRVWSSIVAHLDTPGHEDDFITVADVPRETLAKHPWSLGGGGASALKEHVESRCSQRLEGIADSVGIASFTLEDDVYLTERGALARLSVESRYVRPMVIGEAIRDWALGEVPEALFPYEADLSPCTESQSAALRYLWSSRTALARSLLFGGKTKVQAGLRWFEYGRLTRDKLSTPLTITFAFVATHNHFVLDRGGKVFKQSAPIIKLPATATEDDHLALLAWLNCSAACFWLKQVCFPKTSGTNVGDVRGQDHRIAYEFSGAAVGAIPVPASDERATRYVRELVALAQRRTQIAPAAVLQQSDARTGGALRAAFREAAARDEATFQHMVALQEELDWLWYVRLGLADASVLATDAMLAADTFRIRPDERPHVPDGRAPADASMRSLWQSRKDATAASPELSLLEAPIYKRPWFGVQGVFHRDGWTYDEHAKVAARERMLAMIEAEVMRHEAPCSAHELESALHANPQFEALAEYLSGQEGFSVSAFVSEMLVADAVPYLAAMRHTDEGLAKRARWEHTWSLQRREDAGEAVGEVPVPPKYDRDDWRDARFWTLRGKLDVPRERFVAYPGAELDPKSPVFGWAGWNHLQRARALAALYQQRKADGWDRDRLRPLLAGLLELLPWLLQWHDDPDPELDGLRQGKVWQEFLEGERARLGWSEGDLRAWRPAAPTRAPAAKSKGAGRAKKAKVDAEG